MAPSFDWVSLTSAASPQITGLLSFSIPIPSYLLSVFLSLYFYVNWCITKLFLKSLTRFHITIEIKVIVFCIKVSPILNSTIWAGECDLALPLPEWCSPFSADTHCLLFCFGLFWWTVEVWLHWGNGCQTWDHTQMSILHCAKYVWYYWTWQEMSNSNIVV